MGGLQVLGALHELVGDADEDADEDHRPNPVPYPPDKVPGIGEEGQPLALSEKEHGNREYEQDVLPAASEIPQKAKARHQVKKARQAHLKQGQAGEALPLEHGGQIVAQDEGEENENQGPRADQGGMGIGLCRSPATDRLAAAVQVEGQGQHRRRREGGAAAEPDEELRVGWREGMRPVENAEDQEGEGHHAQAAGPRADVFLVQHVEDHQGHEGAEAFREAMGSMVQVRRIVAAVG